MAVEKMKMMNIVGELSYMDSVIIDILKSKSVNIIDAQLEIDSNANLVVEYQDGKIEKLNSGEISITL